MLCMLSCLLCAQQQIKRKRTEYAKRAQLAPLPFDLLLLEPGISLQITNIFSCSLLSAKHGIHCSTLRAMPWGVAQQTHIQCLICQEGKTRRFWEKAVDTGSDGSLCT